MKLSIIVPAYNEEETIAKTLQGLTSQTYKDVEIIVIDNNSKDKTSEIAKKYVDKVFLETKQGYINAVIRGAKEATGDIITFCDADTMYPANWAKKAMYFFKNPKTVIVYGTCETYDSSKIANFFNYIGYTTFLYISILFRLHNTSGFNFLMRKDAYEKVGGYDPKFQKMSPDIELGKRIAKLGKVKFCPRLKVSSSARRFKEGGNLKTSLMFAKAWWSMVRNKLPDIDYNEYNKIKKL
jgi:glycosyltransferase involved in cell wall biosynthesis